MTVHFATITSVDGRAVGGVLELDTGQVRGWVRIPPDEAPPEDEDPQPWQLALLSSSQLLGTKVPCAELHPARGAG